MVFSSQVFLFLFLPLVLLLYLVLGRWFRNLVLLTASLFFYAWGEQEVVILMLASIVGNYAFGRWLGSAQERG
ncbi:MAG: MBOAT family protein, partial [Planctomycetota bacterium]|nr:MBOAT family protein [Planctomycetota bacterium]